MTEQQEIRAWSLLIAATAKKQVAGGAPELDHHFLLARKIERVIADGWEKNAGASNPTQASPTQD